MRMVGRDRERADRRVDKGDNTSAALRLHLVRAQDRMTAQYSIAPSVVIERCGLVGKSKQAAVVDHMSPVLLTEQCFVEDQDVRIELLYDAACRFRPLAIELTALAWSWTYGAKSLEEVVGS